jgi:glutamate-5-semialdehyde dehydrogenase
VTALLNIVRQVLRSTDLPIDSVVALNPRNRAAVVTLLTAHGLVDVLIPRGGHRLIEYVRTTATVPVIETGAGVCHTYVERSAKLDQAVKIVVNAKTRRYTVCNALDCLVIDQSIAGRLLLKLAAALAAAQVEVRADTASWKILHPIYPAQLLRRATTADYATEFLALRLAIKTVSTTTEAFDFIQTHTSHHSEAIITQSKQLARQFTHTIDAAAVYVNTSTAFTDGFEFGLGAEIGIATQKMHARGPMGLVALTTYQWIVTSHGAIRQR